jgi:hypothetical protein
MIDGDSPLPTVLRVSLKEPLASCRVPLTSIVGPAPGRFVA